LINLFNIFSHQNLTNKVNGHGVRGIEVGDLERQFGNISMSVTEEKSDELILAVKIKDSLSLELDESNNYPFYNRNELNLKSRTLGNWKIGKENIERIRYVLGINTGINNSVVSAYEISGFESGLDENGRQRYCFFSNSSRKEVMKKLDIYQKSLYDLKFGSGNSIVYINKY